MRVGIDMIELNRVPMTQEFLKRIAKPREIEYIKQYKCENGYRQRVAALWCVKEAVMKALGLGKDSGVTMKEIELCHEETGRPYVKLTRVAKSAFEKLNLRDIEISISHSETFATAICIVN